jgi:two-component system NtrC family sensor kinase
LDFDLGVIPPLRCRPQQLSAVLSNLLRNAADAIDTQGRIVLVTRKLQGNIVLEIRDTGRGIPSEQLATLFEPAFQVEYGRVAATNWGLFVCRAIVSEHGGELEIESEPGRGTTAKIVLPWA